MMRITLIDLQMLGLAVTKSRAPDECKSSLVRATGTVEHGRGE